MGFEYQTNLEAVVQALKDYNTSTATPYLSQSLTSKVLEKNIQIVDPEVVPWRNDMIPALFVRLSSKDENFEGIGATGAGSNRVAKRATVTYEIIGLYPKNKAYSTMDTVLNETYTFARNVEAVFRQEYRLSSTALWCQPIKTEFIQPSNLDGTWVKAFITELRAEYLFK